MYSQLQTMHTATVVVMLGMKKAVRYSATPRIFAFMASASSIPNRIAPGMAMTQ